MELFDLDSVNISFDMLGNYVKDYDQMDQGEHFGEGMDSFDFNLDSEMFFNGLEMSMPAILPADQGEVGGVGHHHILANGAHIPHTISNSSSSSSSNNNNNNNSTLRIDSFEANLGMMDFGGLNTVRGGAFDLYHDITAATTTVNATKPKKKQVKKRKSDSNLPTPQAKKKTLQKYSTDGGALPGTESKPALLKKCNSAISPSTTKPQPLVLPKPTLDGEKLKQTSSYRGVSCCGKDRKWQARIRDANKVRYLGRFTTEVEAALVYDEAARALKGDKAPTNFVKMPADQQELLKRSAHANGGRVPPEFEHLVVRVKAKAASPRTSQRKVAQPQLPSSSQQPPQQQQIAGVAGSSSSFDFPDSPLAKVHNKNATPAMSPAHNKTATNTKKAAQVKSRFQLQQGLDKQQQQQVPLPPVPQPNAATTFTDFKL